MPGFFVTKPIVLFVAVLAATLAVYWPGLTGEFLLDDSVNLALVWRWLDGDIGWAQVVFGNTSGPLGRPISLLSFLLTAGVWGKSVVAFKAVNLGLHLVIGTLIFALLWRLFQKDRLFADRRAWWALGIAAVWLLHPLFTSTVFYVVQRMAMLSALFTVLALLAYVQGRLRIEAGCNRSGAFWLLCAVPLLTIFAALSKETGLLAPLLCGVIEVSYFRPNGGKRRPVAVRWFLTAFVLAPVVAGSTFLLLNPEFYSAGYINRPFEPLERLLTQARVLFEYVGSLLMPVGQHFSLYRDDYKISTGLLSPTTTLISVIGWALLAGLAVGLRRRVPGFAAGVGLFLVGHLIESTVFPLLIFFEHRNYLPSLGVFLATASLLALFAKSASRYMDHPSRVFGAAAVGLLLAFAFATFARTLAWQNPMYLLEESVKNYPDSRLGRMELAAQIMNAGPLADIDRAIAQYRHLQNLDLPSTRAIGHMGEIAVTCYARGTTDPDNLSEAFRSQPETLQADYLKAVESLGDVLRQRECEGAPLTEFARRLAETASRAHLPPTHTMVWRLRFEAAQLFAAASQNRPALEQARLAWETGSAELPVGMLLAAIHIRIGEFGAAARLLDIIGPQIPASDENGRALLAEYQEAIDDARENASLSRGFGGSARN
jgi:hypothetical protein